MNTFASFILINWFIDKQKFCIFDFDYFHKNHINISILNQLLNTTKINAEFNFNQLNQIITYHVSLNKNCKIRIFFNKSAKIT